MVLSPQAAQISVPLRHKQPRGQVWEGCLREPQNNKALFGRCHKAASYSPYSLEVLFLERAACARFVAT